MNILSQFVQPDKASYLNSFGPCLWLYFGGKEKHGSGVGGWGKRGRLVR